MTASARTTRPAWRVGLVGLAALALVGLNLRLSLAVLAPLLPEIRADYGLGAGAAGLATTAAVLMFGVAAPIAPVLVSRFQLDLVLVVGLGLMIVGTGVRSLPGPAALYLGMVVLGTGIALLNVVMPVIVKRDFPHAVGLATAVYTSALNIGSAAAAAAAVPLSAALGGWRPTAALAAVPAVIALVVWCSHAPMRGGGAGPLVAAGSLMRSPLAWQVTGYMAMQSLLYYVLLTWLPTIYADNGLSAADAGMVLAVAQVAQLAACILVPIVASRQRDQRLLAAGFAALTGVAYLGIGCAPLASPVLWAALLGLGQGGALTVALMLIVVRSADTGTAVRLSGMAQGVGYLLAAAGPPIVGVLHDVLGGWTLVLILLAGLCAAEVVVGVFAGRDRVTGPVRPVPGPKEKVRQ